MSSYRINPTRVPEAVYPCDCCEGETWPAEDLHWYPRISKWVCPNNSDFADGLLCRGVRLDKWLAGKGAGR
jgi:hypothetical protein